MLTPQWWRQMLTTKKHVNVDAQCWHVWCWLIFTCRTVRSTTLDPKINHFFSLFERPSKSNLNSSACFKFFCLRLIDRRGYISYPCLSAASRRNGHIIRFRSHDIHDIVVHFRQKDSRANPMRWGRQFVTYSRLPNLAAYLAVCLLLRKGIWEVDGLLCDANT